MDPSKYNLNQSKTQHGMNYMEAQLFNQFDVTNGGFMLLLSH